MHVAGVARFDLLTSLGRDDSHGAEEARLHQRRYLGVNGAGLVTGRPIGPLRSRIGLNPVKIAAGEAAGLGLKRIPVEPVGPKIGNPDFQLIHAGMHRIGNLDPIGRQPREAEAFAIKTDFGDFGEVSQLQEEPLLLCQRVRHLKGFAIGRDPREESDTFVVGFGPALQFIEGGLARDPIGKSNGRYRHFWKGFESLTRKGT